MFGTNRSKSVKAPDSSPSFLSKLLSNKKFSVPKQAQSSTNAKADYIGPADPVAKAWRSRWFDEKRVILAEGWLSKKTKANKHLYVPRYVVFSVSKLVPPSMAYWYEEKEVETMFPRGEMFLNKSHDIGYYAKGENNGFELFEYKERKAVWLTTDITFQRMWFEIIYKVLFSVYRDIPVEINEITLLGQTRFQHKDSLEHGENFSARLPMHIKEFLQAPDLIELGIPAEYATIHDFQVTGAGSKEANGLYKAVGVLNGAVMCKNFHGVTLSFEKVKDNKHIWVIGKPKEKPLYATMPMKNDNIDDLYIPPEEDFISNTGIGDEPCPRVYIVSQPSEVRPSVDVEDEEDSGIESRRKPINSLALKYKDILNSHLDSEEEPLEAPRRSRAISTANSIHSRKLSSATKPTDLFITHDSDGEENTDVPPPPPLEELYNPPPPLDNVTIGNWIQVFDPTTNVRYYFNKVTRKSTWNEPLDVSAIKNESRLSSGEVDSKDWKLVSSGSKKYFYNEKTRRSTYTDPVEHSSSSTVSNVKVAALNSAKRRASGLASGGVDLNGLDSNSNGRRSSAVEEGGISRTRAGSSFGASTSLDSRVDSNTSLLTRSNSVRKESNQALAMMRSPSSSLDIIDEETHGEVLPNQKIFKAFGSDGKSITLTASTNSKDVWIVTKLDKRFLYVNLVDGTATLNKEFGGRAVNLDRAMPL